MSLAIIPHLAFFFNIIYSILKKENLIILVFIYILIFFSHKKYISAIQLVELQ